MKRRAFITLLGGAAVASPLVARAQQDERVRRIGIVTAPAEADPEAQLRIRSFHAGLRKLGWIESRNLRVEYRWGVSNPDRSRAVAQEMVALAPDLIAVFGTPPLGALKQATQTIPIVFAQVSDPVDGGFVASAARPGGNVTGFSDYEYSFAVKWAELLKEIAPGVSRAVVLYDRTGPGPRFLPHLEAGAPTIGMRASGTLVASEADVERIVSALAGATDTGIIVLAGAAIFGLRDQIIAAASRHRLPAVYPFRAYALSGGLVSYGANTLAMYEGAASYVDRILKGAKPAELPVQFATKFDFTVNLRTAKAIGLTVPTSILLRADEVIERQCQSPLTAASAPSPSGGLRTAHPSRPWRTWSCPP
jgi:putative ABC transport system substrate-binding protein